MLPSTGEDEVLLFVVSSAGCVVLGDAVDCAEGAVEYTKETFEQITRFE